MKPDNPGRCLDAAGRRPSVSPPPATNSKSAPPIDYAAALDSLDVMEKIMRHFHLRG